ncbi:MAG: MBOAT family protein [Clostridia bacterium]|nr:MBOAT family protein [Clostridia bacterium]
MSFNSLQFLIFLPAVVCLYWILPYKFRWALLLLASYYFYMCWNAKYALLILATTITAYTSGILMGQSSNLRLKKFLLWLTVAICLGLLIFFKYADFLLNSVISIINIFGGNISSVALDIILPVGISFYTFQTLSYVIDVYHGKFKAEKHFGYFALYVSFFPQLVAGPIERPSSLLPQLRQEHYLNKDDAQQGLKWLISGFFRKCVVADFCGIFVDSVYADVSSANSLAVFAASALFFVQIYNDFAGYSEIAIGSARLMGIKLTKNFDRPMTSKSFTEFFRRWHITLNQWFTEYVYIPLGGNRKGKARKILNILIVFALCGLWHGAEWTYVLWGLYAGVLVAIEALFAKPCKSFCLRHNINADKPVINVLRTVCMFVLFVFGCVLFRSQSVTQAFIAFKQLFTAFGFGSQYIMAAMSSLGMEWEQVLQLAVIITAMAAVYYITADKRKNCLPLYKNVTAVAYPVKMSLVFYGVLAIALCWLGLLANSDVSGFAYFQF